MHRIHWLRGLVWQLLLYVNKFSPHLLIKQGRPKTPQELPEKASVYSEGPVPNTNAGNYGGRLNTDVANQMQALEFRFYSDRRRRKMGDDLICY